MPVRRHHRQAIALQQQQRSVQREARLLHRDRKNRSRDHRRQHAHRNLRQHVRHLRQLRKAFARHPRNARPRPPAHQARPLVVLQLYFEIGVRQQPHIIQQPLGWNGPRALLLHSRRTGRTDPQLQIGGRQIDPIPSRFHQHVRQDRYGGLLLNYALRKIQFPNQIRLADCELHHFPSLRLPPARLSPANFSADARRLICSSVISSRAFSNESLTRTVIVGSVEMLISL